MRNLTWGRQDFQGFLNIHLPILSSPFYLGVLPEISVIRVKSRKLRIGYVQAKV
jgi:hypothetical protein